MSALNEILEREIEQVSRFLVFLDQEQDVLKSAQPESLPPIHAEKAATVALLNELETRRIQLIGGTRELSDRARMEAWLKSHPAETKSARLWERLIELARSTKEKNDLNAILIKMHLERTTQALNILTRHAQENTLYGSDGQASVFTGSRIVDSA